MKDTYRKLLAECEGARAVNTHCHHLPDGFQQGQTLDILLENSYAAWNGLTPGRTGESRDDYCRQLRATASFHWLEKGLQRLCGMDAPLCAATWDAYDAKVRALTADAGFHLRALREDCGYDRVILDSLAPCGRQETDETLFVPTYRVNMFLFGYGNDAKDHNGRHPLACCGWDRMPGSYPEYLAAVRNEIRMAKDRGAVALKSALAYDRGQRFLPVSPEQAAAGYRNPEASPEDVIRFQDGVFREICAAAGETGLPLQVHTGLGLLKDSAAMQLRDLIADYPGTRFVLFHGSFPWTQDVVALARTFQNVYADLCWLPLLSAAACESLLRELLESVTPLRLAWGCDTWHSFESLGARMAMNHVLAKTLSGLIDEGRIDPAQAEYVIGCVLKEGAKRCYGL